MSSSNKIVLILTGCLNPPTPMHFRAFELARDHIHHLGLGSVVGGIITPVHDAYKKEGLVAAKHRLAMVRLGLQSSDWIKVSDWECQQEGWTRTKHVLQYHQNQLMQSDMNGNGVMADSIQLKFLCGADLLESFAKPGLWNEKDLEVILSQYGLVVVSRSGCNPEKFIFESDLLTKFRRNITLVTNWEMGEMSSTIIRKYLSRGLSAKYLLDDQVLDYIKKHKLYMPKTEYNEVEFLRSLDEIDSVPKNRRRKRTKNFQTFSGMKKTKRMETDEGTKKLWL